MAKDIIVDEEMSNEEKKATVRKYEDDILGGLLAAASYKYDEEETVRIEIMRNKAVALSFRIRPLSEDEYLRARKEHTQYKRNKSIGTKIADHVDTAAYRSQLIYDATIDEDREKIWDNRSAWEKLSVVNGVDLIDVVLKSGEKNAILDKLDEISGYQLDMGEVAKN